MSEGEEHVTRDRREKISENTITPSQDYLGGNIN